MTCESPVSACSTSTAFEPSGAGVPQVSIAVDTYFPRAHLIECLRILQADFPTAAINLRMTTMQGGERLVFDGTCALAVTIMDVPESAF